MDIAVLEGIVDFDYIDSAYFVDIGDIVGFVDIDSACFDFVDIDFVNFDFVDIDFVEIVDFVGFERID